MRIIELRRTEPMRYFWAKRVSAVDLEQHCARCLVGPYLRCLGSEVTELDDVPLQGGVWYFCGVSAPYRWAANFHAAFREAPGKVATVERKGVRLVLEDAEEIRIAPAYVMGHHHSGERAYDTCRCWQFATKMAATGELPVR